MARRDRIRADVGPAVAMRLIVSRDFGPYFVGNALSASGGWFQNLAAALLVYRQTHSPFLLGILSVAQFAPVLLLAPWSGVVADRFDRRRVILVTQLFAAASSATLAVLAWAGLAEPWIVILFGFALGVATAFSTPASGALLGQLVGTQQLGSAVALNSMTFNLARAIGPALAGLTVATLGIPASFAINSASYVALMLGVVVVRPRPQQRMPREETRLREALRFVRHQPKLIGLLLIVTAVGFASDPINTEAPAFAHAFGEPDTRAGLIIGVFGAGAVAAAFVLAGRVAGSRSRMIATLALLAAGVAAFSVSPWLPLAYVLLVVAGSGSLGATTSATSRLQLGVAESQRGRIMALWGVAFLGLRPFGSLVDGALAGAFGVRVAGVCMALPVLAGAVLLLGMKGRDRTARAREPAPVAPPEG